MHPSNIQDKPLVLLRLKGVLSRFPVSRSTWYTGIKSGKYPQGKKLSEGIVVWDAAEIDELCAKVLGYNVNPLKRVDAGVTK